MLGLDLSITPACITFALIALTWYVIRRKNKTVSYDKIDIRGKTVIVTGASDGIGKETARQLAKGGARVILACRNVTKATAYADDIRTTVNDANLIIKHVDLGDLTSVKKFCDDVIASESCVDILINNAAVLGIPITILPDGTELQFVTNHLGHHLLTRLLLPLIHQSDIKRIVIVSASGYRFGTIQFTSDGQLIPNGGLKQYANTKLANCLFAMELHRRFSSSDAISTFALHPGLISTNILNNMPCNGILGVFKSFLMFTMKNFYASVEKGSEPTMYCATARGLEKFSGKYFEYCQICPGNSKMDAKVAGRLWDYCEAKVHNFL